MTITVFCQTRGQQAQSPGSATNVIRLTAIPGADGPNGSLFVGGKGTGFLELCGISDTAAGEITGGQQYTVTITPVTP